ncbi:hypothetical protein WJX84_007049 [Apatococcus fuscideae]|uniref:Toprim domain-containing protein n=1 Tax=Apatococcus fuscideae TaxID=2026836 RepID=A0AAW1T657_9CHLO
MLQTPPCISLVRLERLYVRHQRLQLLGRAHKAPILWTRGKLSCAGTVRADGDRCTSQEATASEGKPSGSSQQWSAAAALSLQEQQRLCISSLVVVEGKQDQRAVLQALDAPVTVTQGHINERTLVELRQRMLHCPAMIIFMDPDVAGRQARNRLSQEFPQALHAFVPQLQATSPVPSKWHQAGNVGVEHAPALAIRLALQAARQLQPLRKDITRELLESLGLAGSFSDSTGGSQADRRRRVTALLGLGDCNAKQLLRQLNTFSFTPQELHHAVQQVDAALQAAASTPDILRYVREE